MENEVPNVIEAIALTVYAIAGIGGKMPTFTGNVRDILREEEGCTVGAAYDGNTSSTYVVKWWHGRVTIVSTIDTFGGAWDGGVSTDAESAVTLTQEHFVNLVRDRVKYGGH